MTPPIRMVSVPVEPTEEMTMAGAGCLPAVDGVFGLAGALSANVYRAMLTAAPVREEGGVEDGGRLFAEVPLGVAALYRDLENGIRPILATREEAPAEAGEVAEAVERLTSAADFLEGDCVIVGDHEVRGDDLLAVLSTLRAQPQAREEAQPVGLIDGEAVSLPSIAVDGPHRPCEHRLWLARQLLDSRMSDAEAYSTVAFSPAITDLHPAPDALRVAVEKVRDQYKDQMRFCDIEPLGYFREFVRRLDAALQAEQGAK